MLAPDSAHAEVVTVEFSGNNAPELAAHALTRLVTGHRSLILDPANTTDNIEQVRTVCGPQPELKIVLRGCYFWDKIVASGGWPADAPQIERLPENPSSSCLSWPERSSSPAMTRVPRARPRPATVAAKTPGAELIQSLACTLTEVTILLCRKRQLSVPNEPC